MWNDLGPPPNHHSFRNDSIDPIELQRIDHQYSKVIHGLSDLEEDIIPDMEYNQRLINTVREVKKNLLPVNKGNNPFFYNNSMNQNGISTMISSSSPQIIKNPTIIATPPSSDKYDALYNKRTGSSSYDRNNISSNIELLKEEHSKTLGELQKSCNQRIELIQVFLLNFHFQVFISFLNLNQFFISNLFFI